MTSDPTDPLLEPVRKSVTVTLAGPQAFELFTAGLTRWWPLATHSLGQSRASACLLEPGVGGLVYETRDDDQRSPWGRVLVWEPPRRLVMTWHPGLPAEAAQEVELRFTPVAGGTRLELEHRGWEKLGEDAASVRADYERGWEPVLARFVEAGRR